MKVHKGWAKAFPWLQALGRDHYEVYQHSPESEFTKPAENQIKCTRGKPASSAMKLKSYPYDVLCRLDTISDCVSRHIREILECKLYVATISILVTLVEANVPLFDVSTSVRVLVVPHDAKVGSAIYRLRGTDADFDFPLRFEVLGSAGSSIISVENYPCTKNHTFCEGNIVLMSTLEKNRVYDVKLKVTDTSGEYTVLDCTIKASNSTSPTDTIFPHLPVFVIVREDAAPGTELDYIIARKNPQNTRHVSLEISGAKEFSIHQKLASNDTVNGTVTLVGSLDFEKRSLYILTVYAVDPYAEPELDTRNVASFQLAITVQDVQDMPPIFMDVPPITLIGHNTKQNDVVLTVHAEDGDKGDPRDIRYGLVSEGNAYTTFFHMDQVTGNLTLIRPFRDLVGITRPNQPILLNIMAEEVRTQLNEPPAMSSVVTVALLLGDLGNTPPYFEQDEYVARVPENSPQGTALIFGDPYVPEIRDDDMGKNGLFSISLENNNGTFEVSPTVGERRTSFVILVRNNKLLDYESHKTLQFMIVAKEVGPGGSQNSTAHVTVYIDDVNDNPPVFTQSKYEVDLPENVTQGVRVVQVKAEDADSGIYGKILYTQILGLYNTSLLLDDVTGVITISTNRHNFDREEAKSYSFNVVARDAEGNGNRATVPLIIRMVDVNDETPQFDKHTYEFYLSPNQRNFTAPAFIKAIDGDAEAPNNWVKYEIISGNYDNKFYLDEDTGELSVRRPPLSSRRVPRWDKSGDVEVNKDSITLTVRAYDLGVPHRWSTASIHILPSDANTRTMMFIVNGSNPDRQYILSLLNAITGARVRISDIRPYYGGLELISTELSERESSEQKSVVVATVLYDGTAVVDLSKLQRQLLENATSVVKTKVVEAPYRADSSPLFWILMILAILLVLLVLFLLLCCFCPGCPLYLSPKKVNKVSSMENVQFILKEKGPGKETKAVQVEHSGLRREAWSADRQQQYYFNRRNIPPRELYHIISDRHHAQNVAAPAAAAANYVLADEHHSFHSLPAEQHRINEGPAVIYTHELQRLQQQYSQNRGIYVEDIEGAEYPTTGQLLDLRQVRVSHERGRQHGHDIDGSDTDSIRQHEVDRGSDLAMGRKYHKNDIQRGRQNQRREYRIVLQRASNSRNEEDEEEIEIVDERELSPIAHSRREQFYIRDGDAEILRLVTRGRSVEEQAAVQNANEQNNNQERPMTLVPSNSQQSAQETTVENGKDIIMQRFMEDQRNNSAQQNKADDSQATSEKLTYENLRQQDLLMKRLIEEEEARLNNMRLLSDALAQRHEREAESLLEATDHHETQSLPGQATMATQTDVDNSTQTEPMCLMRPPRRRTRSENDESYTEDYESDSLYNQNDEKIFNVRYNDPFHRRYNKSKRRYIGRHGRDHKFKKLGIYQLKHGNRSLKRYKIKTPILEETESVLDTVDDAAPQKNKESKSSSYSENKSSMLRRRNNKIKTISIPSGNMLVIPMDVKENFDDLEDDTPSDSLEESPSKHETQSGDYVMKLFVKNDRDSDEESKHSLKIIDAKNEKQVHQPKYFEIPVAKNHRLRSTSQNAKTPKQVRRRLSLSEPGKDVASELTTRRARSMSQVNDPNQEYKRNEPNTSNKNVPMNPSIRTSSRYMEWYKTKKEERERMRKEEMERKRMEEQKKWDKISKKAKKHTVNIQEQKIYDNKAEASRDYKSARHHKQSNDMMTNDNTLKVLFEDDLDSGIAMSSLIQSQTESSDVVNRSEVPSNNKRMRNQQLMEKKSVFTIAYDDMQTKQIRPESTTPQLNNDL